MEGSDALSARAHQGDQDHSAPDTQSEIANQARLRLVTNEGGALATQAALTPEEFADAYDQAHAEDARRSAEEGERMVEAWYGEGFQN